MGFFTYYIRRVIGILLYIVAYSALWPGLTHPMISIQGNPAFWSNGKVGLAPTDEFMKSRTRSTVELIVDLFDSKFYFPFAVIFLFSIVSPILKLLVLLYGEIKGNIFRVKVDGYKESSMVDLRKALRIMSKYQTVDVFVAIISQQLINSDFIKCQLMDGFYYFLAYSGISILASQIIDAHPPNVSKGGLVSSDSMMSGLDKFLLFCSLSMFFFGIGWSLGFPILAVKFLFQSKIVIGESVASLSTFLLPSLSEVAGGESVFISWIVSTTVVIVPVVVVFLSVVVQCCLCGRRALGGLMRFLADWALLDVFAVSLLTSLFAFASFSVIRTSAPWGFYCVLMAAMSAHEIAGRPNAAADAAVRDKPTAAYHPVAMQEFNMEVDTKEQTVESDEEAEMGPFGPVSPTSRSRRHNSTRQKRGYSSLQEEVESLSPVSPTRRPVVFVQSGGILHILVTITRRLGLPFFILKALGWAIFFLVWFLNSGAASLDLTSLSETLRSNAPLVTAALHTSLPFGVGMCSSIVPSVNDTSSCINKPYLHYEKHTAYEILARWMSGFPAVAVTDMQISVPVEKKFLLSVSGKFDEIKLSLFIGQCLSSFFGPDSDQIPVCSKMFDSIHTWKNVNWSISVRADCSDKAPYVRNIMVDAVQVHNSMTVEEEIAFGLSIPLDDLSEHFRDGIKESIEPLLTKKEGWIPWGTRQFDLVSLLSHLVELNVESHGGSAQVSCPAPTTR